LNTVIPPEPKALVVPDVRRLEQIVSEVRRLA
jgi:hypothetical protein